MKILIRYCLHISHILVNQQTCLHAFLCKAGFGWDWNGCLDVVQLFHETGPLEFVLPCLFRQCSLPYPQSLVMGLVDQTNLLETVAIKGNS